MRAQITPLLAELRFQGMGQVLERELDRAQRQGSPPEEVLWRLLQEEARYRQERSLAYRLRQARLPVDWTLETFPFAHQPSVHRAQIQSLAGLAFLQRAENLVLIGPPGTGKTGLACGLLREACLNGYRGRFYNAQDLLDELYASLADRRTPQLLNRLARYDVLLIDELGYLSLNSEQINAFFKLMALRYEHHSTLITTNLDYPHWYELFQHNPWSMPCSIGSNTTALPCAWRGRRCACPSPAPDLPNPAKDSHPPARTSCPSFRAAPSTTPHRRRRRTPFWTPRYGSSPVLVGLQPF